MKFCIFDWKQINKRRTKTIQEFTMNRYLGSFLLLLTVIRSTRPQVCSLSNDCGVIGGKTRLFCKVTAPDRTQLNWIGPGGNLITAGAILDSSSIDLEEAGDGFYLIILNTAKEDNGTYKCEYSFVLHDCIVTQNDFQALMCEQNVDGRKIIITITYRLPEDLPMISLMDKDEHGITGNFGPVEDGFLKKVLWTSDDLMGGTYNYTVDGACSLLTDCFETVVIPGSSTSSPTTKIGTTVTPDMTTTGPVTASDIVTNASTIATTTSSNSLKIVYGVCGSLGGIIVFVFIAILMYKTKKRNAGNRYTQSNLQHMNHRKDRSSNRYDNRGFADSSQDHRYKTQEPYNSHVSNHSSCMSPDYEQQDRDDHKYLGMSGKYAPYSTGGNHSDEPMDVTYYTGGNHTDEPLNVTYSTGGNHTDEPMDVTYSTGGNHTDDPLDVTYSTGGNHTDDPLDVTYYTGKSQRY